MGLKVGELFLDLGVEGSSKTLGAITGVKTGLQGAASEGLAAKAAIVGAMYALQQLFSTSNKTGTDLTNLNAVMGVSVDTMQRYRYAAQQVGVSNGSVTGTFKTLQDAMTKILTNGGAPDGMFNVAEKVGEFDPADIKRLSEQPEELLQILQKYAQLEPEIGLRNKVLKSFGLGDDMIAALARNAFTPEALAKAPTYSDKEVAQLDRNAAAWANIGTKIEMVFGHLNAKHGGQLVKEISEIVTKVGQLSESFIKLAENAKFFEKLGKVFEGWGLIFDALNDVVSDMNSSKGPESLVGKFLKGAPTKNADGSEKSFWQQFIDDNKQMYQATQEALGDGGAHGVKTDASTERVRRQIFKSAIDRINEERLKAGDAPIMPGTINRYINPQSLQPAPPAVPAPIPPQGRTGDVILNLDQTFNGLQNPADPRATAEATTRAVNQAFRQNPALSQGA